MVFGETSQSSGLWAKNEEFQEPEGGTEKNKLVVKSGNKVYDLSKTHVTVKDEIETCNTTLPSVLPTHLLRGMFFILIRSS